MKTMMLTNLLFNDGNTLALLSFLNLKNSVLFIFLSEQLIRGYLKIGICGGLGRIFDNYKCTLHI